MRLRVMAGATITGCTLVGRLTWRRSLYRAVGFRSLDRVASLDARSGGDRT
jgi:hypothetical protein